MGEAEHDRATKKDDFELEPTDRPVRAYETLLCVALNLAYCLVQFWHLRPVAIVMGVSAGLLIVVPGIKLLLPRPRFSATRGAFVLIGLLTFVLLADPNGLRR